MGYCLWLSVGLGCLGLLCSTVALRYFVMGLFDCFVVNVVNSVVVYYFL